MTIAADTNASLLRRMKHFQRRTKDLTTEVSQLRASREKWRKKSLAEAEEKRLWRTRAQRQEARAELWKHRALTKFPIPATRGGAPRFVDYDEAIDYLAEHEAS